MRLIDADALLERMKRTNRYFNIKFDIDEAPTIDADPVVRCGECGAILVVFADAKARKTVDIGRLHTAPAVAHKPSSDGMVGELQGHKGVSGVAEEG